MTQIEYNKGFDKSNIFSTSATHERFSVLSGRLFKLQFEPVKRFILIDPTSVGFGGQVSRRLLALKLALVLDRQAVFASERDPPYVATFERMNDTDVDESHWGNAIYFNPLIDQVHISYLKLDYKYASDKLKSANLSIEEWASSMLLRDYDLTNISTLDAILLRFFRINPEMNAYVIAKKNELGVSENTLGIHLRRGDKKTESAYLPYQSLNSAIELAFKVWKFESVYIASDSSSAYLDLKIPPGVRLIFDSSEKRYDNANHKMLNANPNLAIQETATAIKNLCLLSSCGGLIGQDNAHFATLSASIVLLRVANSARVVLLDGHTATRSNVFTKTKYRILLSSRHFARLLVPKLLIRKLYEVRYGRIR